MTTIKYIDGDATEPVGDGKKLIPHVCNDCGGWGAGFVLAISKKWPQVEGEYRKWYKTGKNFKLGHIQGVKVTDDIAIINMIGQHDTRSHNGVPPVRYGAIRICLQKVSELALKHKASIHAPKFGSDLAGGSWNEIEKIINEELCAKDIDVTIYNWKG